MVHIGEGVIKLYQHTNKVTYRQAQMALKMPRFRLIDLKN